MDARLETGLIELAKLMAGTSEPWWIIGSTAMVLAGVEGVTPDDIDVVADAKLLQRLLGVIESEPKPHAKFRSNPYTRIKVIGGLDIEFQGDLALWENSVWTPLTFASRIEIRVKDSFVYVPSVSEQLQIFRRFGRLKDLAKASVLEVFIAKFPA